MVSTAAIARALGVSAVSFVVLGYSGVHHTLSAADNRWDWRVLHPEMKRRHLTMYLSHPATVLTGRDVDGLPILMSQMGPGSAGRAGGQQAIDNFWTRWSRTYLPGRPTRLTPEGRAWLKPGYAPIAYPGSSNHEADTWENHAMAVDNVGWQDGWMVANAHRFGLKTFVNVGSEPWHTQPAGYGNSKSSLQSELAARGLNRLTLPPIPHTTPTPSVKENDMQAVDDVDIRFDHTITPGHSVDLHHLAFADAVRVRLAVHAINGTGQAWLTYRHATGWKGDHTTPMLISGPGTTTTIEVPIIDGVARIGLKGAGPYRLLFDLVGVKR